MVDPDPAQAGLVGRDGLAGPGWILRGSGPGTRTPHGGSGHHVAQPGHRSSHRDMAHRQQSTRKVVPGPWRRRRHHRVSLGRVPSGWDDPSERTDVVGRLPGHRRLVLVLAGWAGATGCNPSTVFGSAVGFGFGLQTAVTKDFVPKWERVRGPPGRLDIYVLVVSALGGFILQQSAFKTGVLAPAMPSSNAVTLFGGVILGGHLRRDAEPRHWPRGARLRGADPGRRRSRAAGPGRRTSRGPGPRVQHAPFPAPTS